MIKSQMRQKVALFCENDDFSLKKSALGRRGQGRFWKFPVMKSDSPPFQNGQSSFCEWVLTSRIWAFQRENNRKREHRPPDKNEHSPLVILKNSATSDLNPELFLKMTLLEIIKILYEIQGKDTPVFTLENGADKPQKALFPDSKKGNTKQKLLENGCFFLFEWAW